MKQIYYCNLFAIGLPLLLAIMGIVNDTLLFFALLSTILTGLIQVVLGVFLFLKNQRNLSVKIYLGGVILYFLLYFIINAADLNFDSFIYILTLTPVILAIYLTIIIYKLKSWVF